MSEFGHFHQSSGDMFGVAFMDSWGAGPYVIEMAAQGKSYRFEDSDRFGPVPLTKSGDVRSPGYFGEQSPFWYAWGKWVEQGRRLAPDGLTCFWDHEVAP